MYQKIKEAHKSIADARKKESDNAQRIWVKAADDLEKHL